jgi:hypothetical protein
MKKTFKQILEENAKAAQSPPPAPPSPTPPPVTQPPAASRSAFGQLLETKTKAATAQPNLPPSPRGTKSPATSPPLPPMAPAAQPRSQRLEDVIYLIPGDGADYKCQPGESLYAYHPKEKAASECSARSFLQRMFSNWKSSDLLYYRLRAAQEVSLPPDELPLKDGAGLVHPVDVSVSISAIASGRESDTVARLAEYGAPRETLYGYLATWLDNFAAAERRNGRDPVENFTSSQRSQASAYIAERALKELGLKIECGFYFPEQDQKLPVLQIALADVRVRESGLPGALSATLEVRLRLPIDPTRFGYARQMRRGTAAIRQDIEAIALDWFRASCTLDQFCFAREDVRRGLEGVIRAYAEQKLYMDCDPLVVQCEVPFPKDFRIRLDYTSKARVQPGQHELVVNHNLSIKRHTLGHFYTQGPRPDHLPATPDTWNKAFEQWVEDVCARATHDTFHGKSYAAVSLDFAKHCEPLKEAVEKEFTRIGFTALPIHTLPLDPEIQICLEKKITFDTGDIQCKTRESTVDYALSAHVSLEINSLKEIEKYLLPGHPLKSKFIEVAKETIKNTVRTLDPEILYTRFSTADPLTKELPPEEKITAALAVALRDKFDAQTGTMGITLSPVQTEVTKLYDALRPFEAHRCTVGVESRGRRGELLTFFVHYRVASIAPGGWSTFQEQCRKFPGTEATEKAKLIVAAMDADLAGKARTKLQSLTPAQLASPHPDVPQLVETFGLAEAMQQIAKYHGLTIEITNIEPTPGEWTKRERDLEKKYFDDAVADYDTASQQYRDLQIEFGPDDPKAVEARERVAKCREVLETFGTGHDTFFKGAPALPPPAWDCILTLKAGGGKQSDAHGDKTTGTD